MSERRTLLRGGHVLTMDTAVGDLERGDVLIEGERIAAVGPRLDATADEVVDLAGRLVLPGLIESHVHIWQTPIRGIAAETWAMEYFDVVHPLSGRYRPQDMHAAAYGGAIEYLGNGVTTVVDFCHSVNSPEHADASVDGLREAGVRALFGYSFRDRPEAERRAFHSHAERVADAHRLRTEMLSSDDALVGMAIALNNIAHVDEETNAAEVRCARELGVLATVHSISAWEVEEVHRRGLLGSDLLWVHCTMAADSELALLAEHGGALSCTAEGEFRGGLFPPTGRCARLGVPVGLGVDVVSAFPGDMLRALRFAYHAQRLHDGQTEWFDGRAPRRTERLPTLSARKILRMGTIEAAEAIGLADRTGSLTPGKAADVLVLSTEPFGLGLGDPAAHVVLQASRADVERVYVAGRERVRDGRLLDVDLARMRRLLDEAREHVLGAGWAVTRGGPTSGGPTSGGSTTGPER